MLYNYFKKKNIKDIKIIITYSKIKEDEIENSIF